MEQSTYINSAFDATTEHDPNLTDSQNDDISNCSMFTCSLSNTGSLDCSIGKCTKSSIDTGHHSPPYTHHHTDHRQISLAWHNLRYEQNKSVPLSWFTAKPAPILRRLNGSVRYHTLTGFMGPSGAGKTTLLNCLNRQSSNGSLSNDTEIYVRRETNENKTAHTMVAFIEQHVHQTMFARLTVRELLHYAYRFKNAQQKNPNDTTIKQYVANVLEQLLLDKRVLGRQFGHCSGGEQKRIAIAQELMSYHKPEFLFVDEPTTGLDSNAAYLVMKCLQQLTAAYRITVVVSIHTPSNEILNLFDQLYILAKGGVCIYSGSPNNLRQYLWQQFQMKVEDDRPPVEALLTIACKGVDNPQVQQLAIKTLSDEHEKLLPQIDQLCLLRNGRQLSTVHRKFSPYHLLLQLSRLFGITFYAEVNLFLIQIGLYVFYFILLAALFDHRMIRASGCYSFEERDNSTCSNELKNSSYVDQYINYQAFSVLFIGIIMMCTSAAQYVPLIKVFRNEHRNQWYSTGVFYWSVLVVTLIQLTLFALLIATLSYLLTEHHQVDQYQINWIRFGHYFLFQFLLCLYMQSVGQLLGLVLVDQVEVAIVLCQMCYIFMSLLNGYLITIDDNWYIDGLADLIAVRFISKGLLHSFYGIDQCDTEIEFSLVLYKFHIDVEQIPIYIGRVLINVLLLRTMTLIFMSLKYNSSWPKIRCCMGNKSSSSFEMISLNFNNNKNPTKSKDRPENYSVHVNVVDSGEKQMKMLCRDKIIVAFRSLSLYSNSSVFEIRSNATNGRILNNVNGEFRFGTLNALMGTSGAGKTSLLKVLNGRSKTRLGEESRFYLSRLVKIETCYITQEVSGHLLPGLTAKQTLIYASRLKNSNSGQTNTKIDHELVATNLLQELNIEDTANTLVTRCSGGQQKRLALALELTSIRMPNLICIDEPTSGLDSDSAQLVIECLHQLTRKHNITIVTSIHQPNTDVLNQFDQLYVLARGGMCVYSGPPDTIRDHLRASLSANNFQQLKEIQFPIEHLIKYSCSHWNESTVVKQLSNEMNKHNTDRETLLSQTIPVPDGIHLNRCRFGFSSVSILCQRYMSSVRGVLWRQWMVYVAIYIFYGFSLSIFFHPSIAVPSGCINLEDDFNNTCNRSVEKIVEEEQLTNNYRYNFFFNNIFLFIVLLQSSLNFSKEAIYFFNEHRNGWYSSGSFYVMKSLMEIIPLIPLIMAYVHICNIYETIRPGIYWWFVLMLTIAAIGFQGMGHLFSLLSNGQFTILTLLSSGVYLLFILVGNFFNPIHQLHYGFQFVANFSISRFIFESALLLQYGFGRCRHKQIQSVLYTMMIENDSHFYHCVRMLVFNLLLYRIGAIVVLVMKSNPLENRRHRVQRIVQHQRQLQPSEALLPGLEVHREFHIKHIYV